MLSAKVCCVIHFIIIALNKISEKWILELNVIFFGGIEHGF